MLATPIHTAELRAAIETHWAAAFQPDAPCRTLHAGERVETNAFVRWAELWVQPDGPPEPRRGHPKRFGLSVLAHLFSRDEADLADAERLLDAARAALTNQPVPIDGGLIRLREDEVRDLSRPEGDAEDRPLRHLVLLVDGVAER